MADSASSSAVPKSPTADSHVNKSPRSASRPHSLPVQLLASKDADALASTMQAMSFSDQIDGKTSESVSGLQAIPPPPIDNAWYEQNLSRVLKAQSVARRHLWQPHFNLLLKLHRKRTRVAREIWHSETTYLEGLMTLLTLFKMPLLAKAKIPDQAILTPEQVNTIFINVEQLIDASKKLLKQLQEVVLKWTPHTRVGNIFIKNAEMLKEVFTPYVDHYDKCNDLFIKMKQENKKFQEFLAGVEYKMCDLGLESYLIMPIQRVARYGLLLREYIKQTWQDHDDFADLEEGLKTVDDVAKYVNEHKTKMVNFERVKLINSQIVSIPEDLSAKPERQYILEGAVTELGKIPITHYLFLFNDVLVWTQQVNKKKYMFRKLNWLSRSTAEAGELNSVKIVTDGWETKIFTKSKEEQNKWIAYIENENFTPINEPQHPARPSVVFLERRKMIQSQLQLQLKTGSAGGSRRGSMKKTPSTEKSGDPSRSSSKSSSSKDGGDKFYHRKARTIDMQQLQKDMENQVKKMEKHKDKLSRQGSREKTSGGGSSNGSPRDRPASAQFKATTIAPQDLSGDLLAQLRKLRPADMEGNLASSSESTGAVSGTGAPLKPLPALPPAAAALVDSASAQSISSSSRSNSSDKVRTRTSRSATLSVEDAARLKEKRASDAKSSPSSSSSEKRSVPRSTSHAEGSSKSAVSSSSHEKSSSSSRSSSSSTDKDKPRDKSRSSTHHSSSSRSSEKSSSSSSSSRRHGESSSMKESASLSSIAPAQSPAPSAEAPTQTLETASAPATTQLPTPTQ